MTRVNDSWELAAMIAEEMGNGTEINIRRILKELKDVRPDARRLGYDDEDIVACWRWLRSRETFPIPQARVTTVMLGSPCFLQQWAKSVEDSMPSSVNASAFDDWVREHAAFLRKRGWKYIWPSMESQEDGSRMTYAEARELGLTEENNDGN